MAATITNFISALYAPSNYFSTLFEIKVQRDRQGGAAVSRTTHFAEATIQWQRRSYLLSMPLSIDAVKLVQVADVQLKRVRSQVLPNYKILDSEMSYLSPLGELCSLPLILEEIPNAHPFCASFAHFTAEQLFEAIDQLEAELSRLKFTHGNLKAENIVVTPLCELLVQRPHYASVGEAAGDNFTPLREAVAHYFGTSIPQFSSVDLASCAPKSELFGYTYVGNPFEGICVVVNDMGYGYIDTDGCEIIPAKFVWAGDMQEGRAEVETAEGMGLIDAQGAYVIAPQYEIVEFNPQTTQSLVRECGVWSLFDYQGRIIRELGEKLPAELRRG